MVVSVNGLEELEVLLLFLFLLLDELQAERAVGLLGLVHLAVLIDQGRLVQSVQGTQRHLLDILQRRGGHLLALEWDVLGSALALDAVLVAVESDLQGAVLEDDVASRYADVEASLPPELAHALDQVVSGLKLDRLEVEIDVFLQILLVEQLQGLDSLADDDQVVRRRRRHVRNRRRAARLLTPVTIWVAFRLADEILARLAEPGLLIGSLDALLLRTLRVLLLFGQLLLALREIVLRIGIGVRQLLLRDRRIPLLSEINQHGKRTLLILNHAVLEFRVHHLGNISHL